MPSRKSIPGYNQFDFRLYIQSYSLQKQKESLPIGLKVIPKGLKAYAELQYRNSCDSAVDETNLEQIKAQTNQALRELSKSYCLFLLYHTKM